MTIHYVAYVKLTGELLRIWGIFPSSFDSKRCGKHACVIRNVPRPFIECIKSYLFIGVDNVPEYRFNHLKLKTYIAFKKVYDKAMVGELWDALNRSQRK